MMLDIPELKENLIDTKESPTDGDIKEALTGISRCRKSIFTITK